MRMMFQVTNKFTKADEITVFMPYDPYKAMNGFYSRFLKHLKKGVMEACHLEKHLVGVNFKQVHGVTKRTIFTFNCGVSIDMPSDATPYDYEITIAQLEVLKMSRAK